MVRVPPGKTKSIYDSFEDTLVLLCSTVLGTQAAISLSHKQLSNKGATDNLAGCC